MHDLVSKLLLISLSLSLSVNWFCFFVNFQHMQSEEARIAKEVEAHERRIRKELEKQDVLRRKVLLCFLNVCL